MGSHCTMHNIGTYIRMNIELYTVRYAEQD